MFGSGTGLWEAATDLSSSILLCRKLPELTVAKPLLLEFRNAWSRQIRALYSLQFMTKCPKSLHCLQSLSFLPHVLQIPAPWPILDIQTVANSCGIHSECFLHSRQLHAQALANSSEFSLLCAEVLKYRLEKKQDCCTALRHLL